jgi:signal transduction histidine kinase
MFRSAILKLTGAYLLVLMVISLLFSFAIFQITSREIDTRLQHLQTSFQARGFTDLGSGLRTDEAADASNHIIIQLLYANLIVLGGGGLVSYLFARRTLRPIQEAHEAQSRFTSDASHELRTPLAAMKAEIEVTLRDKLANMSDYKEVLESNLEEVEKLTALSEMLLNLSRLEHDTLNKTTFSLHDATEETIKRYTEKDRISITSSKKPIIYANHTAVSELLSILIDNALKHSTPKSKIVITISAKDDKISFDISNEGGGIDAERLPHIFDRFYQADSSRTSGKQKGYGLGLALAKRLVELQDGDLTVISGVEQVTTFTVLFPSYQKNASKI